MKSTTIVATGTVCWTLVLILTIAVPNLHSGDRYWWPWSGVTGVALGLIGLLYLRRGRGNAAAS